MEHCPPIHHVDEGAHPVARLSRVSHAVRLIRREGRLHLSATATDLNTTIKRSGGGWEDGQLTAEDKKYNNQSGKGEAVGGGDARAMSWSGGRCRGVAGDVVERMRAHGGALDDITRAVDLDGAKTAWRLQKAKLLAGPGRCDDAAAEHAASQGNADADGPKTRGRCGRGTPSEGTCAAGPLLAVRGPGPTSSSSLATARPRPSSMPRPLTRPRPPPWPRPRTRSRLPPWPRPGLVLLLGDGRGPGLVLLLDHRRRPGLVLLLGHGREPGLVLLLGLPRGAAA
jgi:hypothetical protein